jgi:hypothetical protein
MSEIKPIAAQTNRAVIYARFSTDLQNERSIADQVALCRSYAERNGSVVVAVFDDRAVSGASIHQRVGIQRLLIAARERRFDVVIAETMSRVGRDEEDRAAIRIRALNDELRQKLIGGTALMTPGIAALGEEAVARIVKTIEVYDDFCHANDPHEEHDTLARSTWAENGSTSRSIITMRP